MAKIKIENFGAIKNGYDKNDGFFDIAKVTIFIGNQGSGKSTVAKIISTFSWMEKVLFRGDYNKDDFCEEDFINTRLAYHRLENYTLDKTELVYDGDAYKISYKSKKLQIDEKKNTKYVLPQIMYIPSDRAFIASLENAENVKNLPAPLIDFLSVYTPAKKLDTPITLPINNAHVYYDNTSKTVYVKGTDFNIKLSESSSGFQSLVPLYLVSRFLYNKVTSSTNNETMSNEERKNFTRLSASILSNTNLSDEQKRLALSEIGNKFNKSAFINIIEEPELNLFPTSQWELLKELLAFNNAALANKLILTTHSPYFINYLTIAIKTSELFKKCNKSESKISKIVPKDSSINMNDVAIYEMVESKGMIRLLPKYNELPSDENFLNNNLDETNEMFARLLEIEQKCV